MKQTTGDYEAVTFIVRLWREPHAPSERDPDWRGTALHVQSGTERGIQGMESLVQFVQNWLESSPGDHDE
ncbi:MAG: hypothetical protein EHM39_02600 [Chloroflexi bacterium]|nr:MAG: hypothetical protein EHM39_02600 [Chloroflexota bacterium]